MSTGARGIASRLIEIEGSEAARRALWSAINILILAEFYSSVYGIYTYPCRWGIFLLFIRKERLIRALSVYG